MITTIWQNWTNEPAETVYKTGYEGILKDVIDLWDVFTFCDSCGSQYTEYTNRTPQNVAEQILEEVEGVLDYEKENVL
jgi:hypothetical protein